jgi:GT2 family glycosyltransferase
MSYYNFDFKKYFQIDITKNFVIEQEELLLENNINLSKFKKIKVLYNCWFVKQNNWDNNKPTVIIPIKDNYKLLNFTINNIIENEVNKISNIIIIDDRSTEKLIKEITIKNNFSYLKIDNQKGFNFSMLNNIAALISSILGSKELILWNSDLWTPDDKTIPALLKKHSLEQAIISGTKLVYPPKSMTFRDKDKIIDDSFFQTIQFGGSFWTFTGSFIKYSPNHHRRFKNKNDVLSSCDKQEIFVTGAFQIINLNWFIESGGLNPSLSKNFQDVDLCLKVLEENKKVLYFGKDFYLYHDESISLEKEGKYDKQLLNDHVLFGKIWNDKIEQLIF